MERADYYRRILETVFAVHPVPPIYNGVGRCKSEKGGRCRKKCKSVQEKMSGFLFNRLFSRCEVRNSQSNPKRSKFIRTEKFAASLAFYLSDFPVVCYLGFEHHVCGNRLRPRGNRTLTWKL